MVYNNLKGNFRSLNENFYKNITDMTNLGFYEDSNGNVYVKVEQKVFGVLPLKYRNYIVNQYMFPIEVYNKLINQKIHFNGTGIRYIASINMYAIDKDSDLSIFRKIDTLGSHYGGQPEVHKHNDLPDKDKKLIIKGVESASIIHDKKHICDKNTKRLEKKLNSKRK